jgi:hypothetical protein
LIRATWKTFPKKEKREKMEMRNSQRENLNNGHKNNNVVTHILTPEAVVVRKGGFAHNNRAESQVGETEFPHNSLMKNGS